MCRGRIICPEVRNQINLRAILVSLERRKKENGQVEKWEEGFYAKYTTRGQ